mgnify:CR=1 FL=1
MRHQVRKKQLGRPKAHRSSMMQNLANSLVMHERIKTTEVRAKQLRSLVDRIISMSKKKDAREAIRYLSQQGIQITASKKICSALVKRYEGRSSGFTRITPFGLRKGDNATIVYIELVA